ncbi:hypothetical protein SAMN04488564_1278 [Lentzea waywayandensis]|uniref:Uncharacterized protein n=1 Tax=Lentzea waywayandensis TaxID=84724 RepID=A0A1I6FJF7_9PSEU|nr:hypothetical protein SAMN04488564_1278 [Lentzea waywayandensis]
MCENSLKSVCDGQYVRQICLCCALLARQSDWKFQQSERIAAGFAQQPPAHGLCHSGKALLQKGFGRIVIER